MLAGTSLTLLVGLAGPAHAATSPAPVLPIEISLPNLVKQPTTAPSHPVKVEVPGVAKVEVDLPDVGSLLGGAKAESAAPEPSQPTAPNRPTARNRPTATARPDAPRPAATAPARNVPAGSTTDAPRAARSTAPSVPVAGSAPDAAPVAAELPVRRTGDSAPAARQPAAAKARAAAEEFHKMLKGELPVWLLVGIVGACAVGTAMVVRSGRRQDAS